MSRQLYRALNTVKVSFDASVSVRIVFPFDANSTDAWAIAAPFESETTPEIFVTGCWAEAVPIDNYGINNTTNVQTRRLLGVRRPGAALLS